VSFFIDNWPLVLLALTSGGMLLWPVITKGAQGGGLSASEAVMLMNREKAVVVDVCEPAEFAAGHITGAKNIPLADLEGKLPTTVKNKTVPLILVCASGVRSRRALAVATRLGYDKAQSLGGGMAAWREASLPVEKA
jgi:rhodanese-related sulfurtransferase